MMTHDDPETQLAPTRSAFHEAPTPLAWSADDVDDVVPYPATGQTRTELFTDGDEQRYAWGTVAMFVALMAVVIGGAACIIWTVHLDSQENASLAPVSQEAPPPAAAPIAPSPDDKVVPSPTPFIAPPLPPTPPPVVVSPPPPPLSIDDQYLTALRSDGISSHDGDSGSLGIAHAVCRARDRGMTLDEMAREIGQQNPQLSGEAAQFIMTAAIHYFCPPPTGGN